MTGAAGYELFDHPADVGVRAWGPDAATAFVEAARGMFAVILGRDVRELPAQSRHEHRTVEVEGEDLEELLVNWLAELLYLYEADCFAPHSFAMNACAPPRCAAEIEGLRLTGSEVAAGVGVKAVTYHQLRVDLSPEHVAVQVILDI